MMLKRVDQSGAGRVKGRGARGGLDNEGGKAPGFSNSSAGFFRRKGQIGVALSFRIGTIAGNLG
jgi:hypothetical protein